MKKRLYRVHQLPGHTAPPAPDTGPLKRLWIVLCLFWTLAVLAQGSTRSGGVQDYDVIVAFAPPFAGAFLLRLCRWIVTGG